MILLRQIRASNNHNNLVVLYILDYFHFILVQDSSVKGFCHSQAAFIHNMTLMAFICVLIDIDIKGEFLYRANTYLASMLKLLHLFILTLYSKPHWIKYEHLKLLNTC